MDVCNSSNFTAMTSATPYVIDSAGIIGTIVLVVLIGQTPSFRNLSGLLLAAEQLACLMEQILSVGTTISGQYSKNSAQVILFGLTQTAKNISLVLLMLINSNLYLAVCKPTAYRTMVTLKRVVFILTSTLVVNITLGLCVMFDEDYFVFDCSKGGMPYPNTTLAILWHPVLCMVQAIGAIGFNAIFLSKIYRQRSQTERKGSESNNQINLAKFIFILAIMYTFTYICMYVCFYAKVFMDRVGFDTDCAMFVFLNVNKVYVNLRLFFYLPLYKPLRNTLMTSLKRWRSRRVHPEENAQAGHRNNRSISLPPIDS